MATQPERIVLTYDDYTAIPNDRNRYELFEGELEVTPAPGTRHQIVVTNLALLLGNHIRKRKLGRLLVAPCDVLLSDITVVQPDLLFVALERETIITPKYVQGAPDLVVEVISPGTERTDRDVKRQLYARYGVRHYWLIDPERREAAAYVLEEPGYRELVRAQGSDEFAAAPFADLIVSLTEVWES